jgi:hypothetical protein
MSRAADDGLWLGQGAFLLGLALVTAFVLVCAAAGVR